MIRLATFIALLTVCQLPAMAAQPVAERAYAHLDLEISGPRSVPSGETVNLRIGLSNQTRMAIRIVTEPGTGLPDGVYRVEGPRGLVRSSPDAERRGLTLQQQVVAPGDRLEEIAAISKVYDMKVPGIYRITLSRHLPDGAVVTAAPVSVTIKP